MGGLIQLDITSELWEMSQCNPSMTIKKRKKASTKKVQ
jgi:hypothetical protein